MTNESGLGNSSERNLAEAIAASQAEVAAILAEDAAAFADSLASDLIVNSPLGTINRRADTLAAFAGGFIRYDAFDRRVEYAGQLGELVVIMGQEVLVPKGRALNAGKTVHRRFTDVWRKERNVWRLALRQSTIAKVE
jgi:ketosteroid isomerase-like protein